MTTEPKVVDRIRKLLALAASPNENEASAAAAKAHALLAEHKLSMTDVESNEEETTIDQLNTDSGGNSPWIRTLWHATARLNFCEYVFAKNGRRTVHHIIGDPASALATKHMAAYLEGAARQLARADRKLHAESSRYEGNFRRACAFRIAARLHERTKALRQGRDAQNNIANVSNLPAVYASNDKALNAFKAQAFSDLKFAKSTHTISDRTAAARGRAAGDNVGLDTQLAHTRRPATLAISSNHGAI